MAFKPGYLGHFSLDATGGTLVNLSGYIGDVTVPQSIDQFDVSVMGTAAKQFVAGLTDGDTIALSGPYDVALHTHMLGVKAAQSAGTASFTYQWGPGGSIAGQAKVVGECLLAGYQTSGGVGGRAEWTASLQVTGVVANSTF